MTAADKVFVGAIPEIYDSLLVPLIFEPYADDLADRVAAGQPQRILETAAGTGVLTRALARRLPGEAQIVATDLNPPMLERAAQRQGADARIAWQQADALALPFEAHGFDAVACQFGAMFFPDRVAGYAEARRVLRPGGRFLFNVWGAIEDNEFADAVIQALAGLFPDDPPRFLARTPHGYHDVARIEGDVAAAGFSRISLETVDKAGRAAAPLAAATALCQGSPLRAEIEARAPGRLMEVTAAVAQALAGRFGSGPIEGRMRAHVVTAAA